MDHQRGRLLGGRYRIEAELGTGSSASVFLALDTRLDRHVAIKLLHPGLAADSTLVRRMGAEARAVAMLNHPHIVHVYDWGEETDGPFLVMEYLGGGTLKDVLRRAGRVSVPQAVAIGAAAAKALAFAHEKGIVHRDVKPANLLFDQHGVVHVADFGLARMLASARWTEPSGVVLGTARYASPEQALSHPLDGASDIYSLALVLYEALTGEAPFVGETPFTTLMNRVGRALPAAFEVGPLMPILEAATRSLPADRPDATTFAQALDRLASTLDAPQPLPLRREDPLVIVDDAAEDADATILDGPGRPDATLMYGAAPADDETGVIATESHRRHSAGRKRHLGAAIATRRVAIVSAGCLIVLAAAAVYAVPRYVLDTHIVPKVTGMNLVSVHRQVAHAGLRVRVASATFSVPVPKGDVVSQSPGPGARERAGSVLTVSLSLGPKPVAVPRLTGSTRATAIRTLRHLHLLAKVLPTYSETVPAGRVVATSPASGTVPYGSKVVVRSSIGPQPRTIPQLATLSYAIASAKLRALRLVPVRALAYSSTVARGDVAATNPTAGTGGVPVGSRVTVVISKGPQLVDVPSVAGQPIAQAIATLQQAGLVVSEQIGPPFATVASVTDPAPGTAVAVGTSVTLYVS